MEKLHDVCLSPIAAVRGSVPVDSIEGTHLHWCEHMRSAAACSMHRRLKSFVGAPHCASATCAPMTSVLSSSVRTLALSLVLLLWAGMLPTSFTVCCARYAQVSGELGLSCCWRVTPGDALALKLRAAKEELLQKQEVLALLAERSAAATSAAAAEAAAARPGSLLPAAAGVHDPCLLQSLSSHALRQHKPGAQMEVTWVLTGQLRG